MLTDKDYCDYDTCVALKKLGYKEKTLAYYTSEGIFHWIRAYIYDVAIPDLANSSNKKPYKHIIDAMSLYEAQKWLREEKKLHITIFSQSQESWQYRITKPHQKLEDGLHGEDFSSFEEALSEGVRTSIKILQDEQKENN